MTTIGAAWLTTDKNDEYYISAKFDDGILPLTITADKKLIIKQNKSKKDKQPDYYIEIFVPKLTEADRSEKEAEKPEEFPFF